MHFWHRHAGPAGPALAGPSLPPPSEPSRELVLLDPATTEFRREGHALQMRQSGEEEWREVSLVRLFPLSEPDRWVSVLDKDGNEVGIVASVRDLPSPHLQCVQEELRRRYLVPEIERILACRDRYDLVEWTVRTDRGRITFLTRNLREQVQEPLPRRLTLIDVEGNRYDVPDVERLDAQSRRWLEERL
jgi:hypothetical protein